jgi:UDPglucose 6-dehydrogenase
MTRISVVGLGRLGACTAACFAYRGFPVIGVDVNKKTIDLVNAGEAPVIEPRLQELITAAGNRLKATDDFEEAVRNSEVTFLITPTPSEPDGHFSDKYLQDALERLALALKKTEKSDHLFVITSTVSPGTIGESLIPLIERVSKRRLNAGFGICYNPEFIALGSVVHDFLNPDLLLIGESSSSAGDRLVEIHKQVCVNDPHIARMSIISAEITKISLNAYITMKISFANTLANICGVIRDTDIDAITGALGADKRISPYYLKGGVSFGGPCFPRDNRAFIAFANKYGCDAKLAEATDLVNEFQIQAITELVLKHLPSVSDKSVSILGLAYKPNTPVIEESLAVKIIDRLLHERAKVTVYDPLAMDQARLVFGDAIAYATSVKDCMSRSALVIITTPSKEFKNVDDSFITHNPTTIVDWWRIIEPSSFRKNVTYVTVGKSSLKTS